MNAKTPRKPGPVPVPRTTVVSHMPNHLVTLLDTMRAATGQSRSAFLAQLVADEGARRGAVDDEETEAA